jgi:hypothetical protein
MDEKTIARFRAKVDVRGPDECWPWMACLNTYGYGAFTIGYGAARRTEKAHRVAFFLEHGRWPVPYGYHRCDNRPCCNPAHIFEGTAVDNNADMRAKGRGVNPPRLCGELHWRRANH